MKNGMLRFFLPVLIPLLSIGAAAHQDNDVYMPRDVQAAYAKQTRSKDGKPGPRYWQNSADYTIRASVNPENRLLTGTETIAYRNNSPDTLKQIVLKVYQNLYKSGARRNFEITEETVTPGMNVASLKAGGVTLDEEYKAKNTYTDGTNMIVKLPTPLPPQQTLMLECGWSFIIPKGTNIRMGTYGDSTFFVAYWYPRFAVYDDVRGWDLNQYNGEHEMYHDYGKYDVEISVPSGFGVWATGVLQNPSDLLNQPYLDRYHSSMIVDTVVKIISGEEAARKNAYKKDEPVSVWKYTAENVNDFAFGMSDRYIWEGTSATIQQGKKVRINVAYNPASKTFVDVAPDAKAVIEGMSLSFPGIAYPYPQMTVFNGDDGMEFPMIVNDGEFKNRVTDAYVTTHEIAHTYFPFMVGINETLYSWMDEGMAYHLPVDVQKKVSNADHRIRAAKGYEKFAGKQADYPLMIPVTASTGGNLQMLAYYKASIPYEILRASLGDEQYKKALQEFVERWEGKHPLPYDYFYTFNEVLNKDMTWFWKAWYFEPGYPDLAIKDVRQEGGKVRIQVEKVGNMPTPIRLKVETGSGAPIMLEETVFAWEKGNTDVWLEAKADGAVASVELGGNLIPDSNPANNKWKAN